MKRRPRVVSVGMVLACLVFAVVVAVGSVPLLAWWSQQWVRIPAGRGFEEYRISSGPDQGGGYWRHRSFGSECWLYGSAAWFSQNPTTGTAVQSDPRPAWATPPDGSSPEIFVSLSVGAPLRSFRGWRFETASMRQIAGPIWLLERPSRMLDVDRPVGGVELPIVPRWPGLLANTLFFFAIPFVPWTLLRWRRLSRIERLGLCYACRYEFPRDIETCPECGTTRPPPRSGTGMNPFTEPRDDVT